MDNNCMKLHRCALGFSFGLIWALGVLMLGAGGMYMEGWAAMANGLLGEIYVGYEISWMGILIGVAWAFADGFITGFILAWIYNCVANCCCKKSCG